MGLKCLWYFECFWSWWLKVQWEGQIGVEWGEWTPLHCVLSNWKSNGPKLVVFYIRLWGDVQGRDPSTDMGAYATLFIAGKNQNVFVQPLTSIERAEVHFKATTWLVIMSKPIFQLFCNPKKGIKHLPNN